MIRPKAVAIGVLTLVALALFWPSSIDPALARAEQNGYRAARRAAVHRRLAAEAIRASEIARFATDGRTRSARLHFASIAADSEPFVGVVSIDSTPRSIMGGLQPGDTLVTLQLARARVRQVAMEAYEAIASIEVMITIERARSDSAISHLQAALAMSSAARSRRLEPALSAPRSRA